MFSKEQSVSLDYAKSLGIISVVIGHYNLTPFGIPQPYLFHMPLFFFLGGMFLNPGKSMKTSMLSILKKHLLYIAITYLIIGVISSFILHNTASTINNPFPGSVGEIVNSIYRSDFHINSLFLVAWFLLAYSLSSILSLCIVKVISGLKHSRLLIIIFSVLLGYSGMVLVPPLFQPGWHIHFNYISQALTGSMFMLLGYALKDIALRAGNAIAMLFGLLIVSYFTNSSLVSAMTMSWSVYPSGFVITTAISLICIYIVLSLSGMIQRYFGESILLQVGKSSKTIMSYHLLVMYLIDLIFWKNGFVNIKDVNALTHYYTPYIWPLYILTPIITLTGANMFYRYIKSTFKRKGVFDAKLTSIA